MSDDLKEKLIVEQLVVDILLKRRQGFWETPRNLVLIVAAAAAVAGTLGYHIGAQPVPPPVVINLPPASAR